MTFESKVTQKWKRLPREIIVIEKRGVLPNRYKHGQDILMELEK